MTGKTVIAATLCAAAAAVAVIAAEDAAGKKECTSKTSETSLVTNENGSVSRSFTECNITTNGNMVTERRRETRTTLDTAGNVLETSTSEYAQSYTVGDTVAAMPFHAAPTGGEQDSKASESFLGLKFGDKFEGDAFEDDSDEPTLKRAAFEPAKKLAGFDDYYVYVTPKTHKVVKICACAKSAVEPGARWRRHYLVEALEKKYSTCARLCSIMRPIYAFDIGGGRYVTACLSDASYDYETVVAAWDDAMLTLAADETEQIRREARATARERRLKRINEAAEAF